MIRKLLFAAACLAGCAPSPPEPHADGELIRGAVLLAQARADEAAQPDSGK